MFDIGPTHFVVVSIMLFAAGVATVLTKRNVIGILIGVELIINGAAINLVSYNRFLWGHGIDGQMFAIFVIVVAAAEAAIALAIFLNFYNNFGSVDAERADELKG